MKPIKLLAELKNDMSSFSRERPYKKKPISNDSTLIRKHFPRQSVIGPVNHNKFDSQATLTKHTGDVISTMNPMFKFNTLKVQNVSTCQGVKLKSTNSFSNHQRVINGTGYNTISSREPLRFIKPTNTTSTFMAKAVSGYINKYNNEEEEEGLPLQPHEIENQNRDDSINTLEDNNCQGKIFIR